jgi:hypothetical protein
MFNRLRAIQLDLGIKKEALGLFYSLIFVAISVLPIQGIKI